MTPLRKKAEEIEEKYDLDYSLRFAGYPPGVSEDVEMAKVIEAALKEVVRECAEIAKGEMRNTSLLTCYPPKSSAAWNTVNKIEQKYLENPNDE
jgi:hypothetical protein